MTVPSDDGFDPAIHLRVNVVDIDNQRELSAMGIQIKQSKTDPFRSGINLLVCSTSASLCPVAAMLHYLEVCGTGPGPFFQYEDGCALTRA